jgi:hypothetical protein
MMTDNITLPRAVGKTIRKALTRRERYLFPTEQAALAAIDAALAEPSLKVSVDPTAFTASAFSQAAVLEQAEAFETAYQTKSAALRAALAEQDAIARAVEAAVKECVTICEQQRVKILKNPTDPSWTEHLAEVQSEMKQRFGVEMGYPALAEPPAKREPATMQQIVATHRTTYGAPWLDEFDRAWKAAERFHGIRKEDGK